MHSVWPTWKNWPLYTRNCPLGLSKKMYLSSAELSIHLDHDSQIKKKNNSQEITIQMDCPSSGQFPKPRSIFENREFVCTSINYQIRLEKKGKKTWSNSKRMGWEGEIKTKVVAINAHHLKWPILRERKRTIYSDCTHVRKYSHYQIVVVKNRPMQSSPQFNTSQYCYCFFLSFHPKNKMLWTQRFQNSKPD